MLTTGRCVDVCHSVPVGRTPHLHASSVALTNPSNRLFAPSVTMDARVHQPCWDKKSRRLIGRIFSSSSSSSSSSSPSTSNEADATRTGDEIPPGCSRYTVKLSKPLGMVLEETREGTIMVAEVIPGGNAAATGVIQPGDMLIATSGMTRVGREQMYGETVVRSGETFVRLQTQGESFDTVLAAIGSMPGSMKVTLEFQRC